jgi:hypothetical protein
MEALFQRFLDRKPVTSLPSWTKLQVSSIVKVLTLQAHHLKSSNAHMRSLFSADPNRAEHMTLSACDITLDYSKNRIDRAGLELLFQLFDEAEVDVHKELMFAGAKINITENRSLDAFAYNSEGPCCMWLSEIVPISPYMLMATT